MGSVRVGTSGWSYKDWTSVFYPAALRPAGFLGHYAERFDIVEVDSSYYRIPSDRTVRGWFDKTPDHFRFAVKTPSVITHEKILLNCDAERDEFLEALEALGPKLHCVLLQFGYFNRKTFPIARGFFDRLDKFLHALPDPRRVAVEIRNKSWLVDEFFQLLRSNGSSFVLTEHAWMPPVERVLESHDCLTGDFLYLRLIGDRKGIETVTTTWDKVVVDRKERFAAIARALAGAIPEADVVAFINNHYAGHAPASCADFLTALAAAGALPSDE